MKPFRLFAETLRGLVEWIIGSIPGPAGYAVRWPYYRIILGALGWGALMDVGVRIENPKTVFIGRRAWIDRNVLIIGAVSDPMKGRRGRWVRRDADVEARVVIGEGTHIGPNCVLNGMAGIYIGSKLTVAAGTKIYSLSHHYRSCDTKKWAAFTSRTHRDEQFMIAGPVRLGDRSGVGLHSVVLPGAELADESFLTIGSTLRGATEPNRVYAGNPAREVGPRSMADIGEES